MASAKLPLSDRHSHVNLSLQSLRHRYAARTKGRLNQQGHPSAAHNCTDAAKAGPGVTSLVAVIMPDLTRPYSVIPCTYLWN